jgi:hypothetical protein
MPSITLTWTGRTTDHTTQDELIGYLGALAEQSALLERYPASMPPISHLLAAQRADGVPEQEAIKRVDLTVRGPTVISGDVMGDPDDFIAAAKEAGFELETGEGWSRITLGEVGVRGIDFRLCDPRRLYPTANRLSFLFIDAPEVPFLDGRLVAQTRSKDLPEGHPMRGKPCWYSECPSIHLRYVLEDWTQRLLAWVRFFFIDDLAWQGWSAMQHWDEEREKLDVLVAETSAEAAKRESFDALKQAMLVEAAEWLGQFAAMEGASAPN